MKYLIYLFLFLYIQSSQAITSFNRPLSQLQYQRAGTLNCSGTWNNGIYNWGITGSSTQHIDTFEDGSTTICGSYIFVKIEYICSNGHNPHPGKFNCSDLELRYRSLPLQCPTNSTINGNICNVNTGYNAVNIGTQQTPNWTVQPIGSECQNGTVYNSENGTCGAPPAPDCTTKTTTKIYPFTRSTGCTDGENCETPNIEIPSFYCDAGCQYDFIRTVSAVHRCFSLPSETNTKVYCEVDAKGSGTNCSNVSISIDGTNGIPQSTTPAINQSINGGGTTGRSSGNPTSSTPSLGGTGTNNTGGGSSPTNGTAPTGGTQQTTTASQASTNCDGCATEGTQAQVLKSLTDIQGGVQAPTFDTGITSNDLGGMLVQNDAIQGMFRLNMPAHSRTCPTFNISIPFFSMNQIMDSHCTIIADHYQTVRNLGIVAWIITAIIVILGA